MAMTINASQLMMQQMGQMKKIASEQVMHNNPALNTSHNLQTLDGSPSGLKSGQESVNFSDLLGSAIKQVNTIQQASGKLKNDFEMGKDGVSLVEVMVAGEKSSVAFTALLQTRNKLLRAYTQILNTRV